MFIFKWIRTIKEWESEKNIKITGYTNTSKEVFSDLMKHYSIVLLSFSEYNDKLMWKVYEVSVKNVDIIFALVDESSKIRDAFSYFIDKFWIKDIDYIKPYWVELPEEKLKIIINKLFDELEEKNSWVKSSKKLSKGWSNEKILSANQIKDLLSDIDLFLEDANELLNDSKDIVPALSFELEKSIWEIMKYKKTTNIYKIADIYKNSLELYEKLYNTYYDHLKQKEIESSSKNIISEVDIIREYKNYLKVQRSKAIEKVDSKQFKFQEYEVLYYKIFWKFWIDLKLLFIEFKKKYQLDYFTFKDLLDFLQLLFIFLIIWYSIIIFYNMISWEDFTAQLVSFYYILNFSIYGFIVTIWSLFYKKWVTISILVMIALFLLFVFIKKYFAL